MEVDNSDSLARLDFGENLTLVRSNLSFNLSNMEASYSYSYDTSVRIVMLSVLLAAALVGNSLAFHTLVTNRSKDGFLFYGFD